MVLDEVQYPAVCFSQGTILAASSHDQLTTCSTLELRRGWYRDLLLVDSAGHGYNIAGARRTGYLGPFWGFRLFRRMLRVKPKVASGPFDVSLAALKERIIEMLDDDEAYWSEIAGLKEIKSKVRSAATHREIIRLPYWS
jgi:hypothetical protein